MPSLSLRAQPPIGDVENNGKKNEAAVFRPLNDTSAALRPHGFI
jgi:hypothetical protein